VGVSPFQSAIEALLKPLEFTARDDFAHIERVRNLAESVLAAGACAAGLAIPHEAREAIRSNAQRVADAGEGPARAAEIRRALAELRPLADPGWGEAALLRSPAALPGVGPKRAEVLAKRGLATVADLLFHLPSRYDDRRSLAKIAELEVGRRGTFTARVLVSDFVAQGGRRRPRRGRAFEAVVTDDTGTIRLKWFHGTDAIAKMARKDARLLVTGDVTRYRFDREIVHPEIEPLPEPGEAGAADAAGLGQITPDYASPEGLHPRALRRLVEKAVSEYADLVSGHLPEALVREQRLPEPAAALRELHQPGPESDVAALRSGQSAAHARLVLEELYLLELGLALRRASRSREPGIAVGGGAERARRAAGKLPFRLTAAQERVWDEICADLVRPHPMSRLLEGDVGCGKTVVAFLAALAVAEGGHQTALMAPTELLAEQHLRTLTGIARSAGEGAGAGDEAAEGAGLRLALLSSSLPRARAEAVRRAIAAGEVDLAIGTHALLQASVEFQSLALVVIDEQHRFGVRQRAALAEKTPGAATPHTLVMTATPIPRTLALTLHGDLDLSVIDELPPGRSPTRTLLVRPGEGGRVSELLRRIVARGEQAYVVYPLVEESAKIDLRSAVESAAMIRRAFPDMNVDLVHGQMESDERIATMDRFARGEIQVLVSTTVIEVGVDVPNATLMIIEHAERFGLAQLHQLRGRVGRGEREGTCVCVARTVTEDSEARLAALLATNDGFAIADADLAIRGPGEFLGTRQSGRLPDLRIADLTRDARWIPVARAAALRTLRDDPQLRRSQVLAHLVQARWGDRLALAGVG
jgi:ATP-dependent DNA helicase RecG